MNCAELRSDIDGLEQELRALGEKVETVREAEEHDKELQEVVKSINSSSADQVLEKYLKDFQEQNLDILPVVTFGDRIDVKNAAGNPANIFSIAATKDGHVLVGGDDGAFYAGSYNEWGELELSERIDIRNSNGKPAFIGSIAITKDGRVLVGGYDGAFYAGSYNEWGELELGERIDIKDVDGGPVCIRAITALDDKRVLIGGNWGVLYAGSYNDQGELELGERVDIRDANGDPARVESIATMKDGRVLIGGINSALYTGRCGINLETLKQHLPEIVKKGVT